MRYLALCLALGFVLSATVAESEPHSKFWERVATGIEHDIEIALDRVRALYADANRPILTVEHEQLRTRMLADARGILRYAQGLDPDNQDVLELIAYVEELRGQTDKALSAYETLFEGRYERDLSSQVCTRYGLLLARLDQSRRAISTLRQCAGQPFIKGSHVYRTYALVNIGNLYSADGRIGDAIRLLEREADAHGYLAEFTLAVLYDKDERITETYELLENLQNRFRTRLMSMVSQEIEKMPMVPAEDRHYFTAFVLEIHGALPEAREEWHHYIRSGAKARFSARAQQHINAIDALLAAQNKRTASNPR